ncbi:sigma-70 family RNA polymerase sigma factor [Inquilinus sp. KBS0705]|nr:sigma-70 family RNA polymerase sigma factor [Inquilinus sp. KBS0705]
MVTDNTSAQREKLIMELYKSTFPVVARHVAKMGGSFDDARDVFQDALVAYYEKVVNANIPVQNDKGYLMGIAKHLWLKKIKNGQGNLPLTDSMDMADEPEQNPSSAKVLHYLQSAGKKCMDLLSAFYYDKLPMHRVAELFGYSGERSVTVQKYKCLEKVRETVKQQALVYEDFID